MYRKTPTNWGDLAKRYAAQTRECLNVIIGAILLIDRHRLIGINVVEKSKAPTQHPNASKCKVLLYLPPIGQIFVFNCKLMPPKFDI